MQPVNVICIKWGRKYGPEYVNILRNMVARHLSRPHRFVCLSDDTEGLDPTVEVHPIPRVGYADFDQRLPWTFGHGWLKVATFAAPLYDLVGPTLFIDLDVVIVDSIDAFFDPPGDFLVIREWDKDDGTGNTSVYRFEANAHPELIEHLKNHKDQVMAEVRNEQEYVTQSLAKQGRLGYWPDEWCVSFKRHCMKRGLRGWFEEATIPPGAKIVAFHGRPNPPDAIIGKSGKWYRRVLPVRWVAERWR
jgi:hypothetical protein